MGHKIRLLGRAENVESLTRREPDLQFCNHKPYNRLNDFESIQDRVNSGEDYLLDFEDFAGIYERRDSEKFGRDIYED